jgi:hypothetical protein
VVRNPSKLSLLLLSSLFFQSFEKWVRISFFYFMVVKKWIFWNFSIQSDHFLRKDSKYILKTCFSCHIFHSILITLVQ